MDFLQGTTGYFETIFSKNKPDILIRLMNYHNFVAEGFFEADKDFLKPTIDFLRPIP